MIQDDQNTWEGVPSTLGRLDVSVQGETPNSKGELDHHNVIIKPEDRPDDTEFDENKRKNVAATTSDAAELLKGIEKENQKFETMVVEQTSIKGDGDLISDTRELCKAEEYAREAGLQEDEKVDGIQGEEKQPRKRKRNLMSEREINLIEKALVDEPDMQRNSASLQSWADTLSAQGSEITASQLKNWWLNNRKARLARAARESRAPSEGENAYLDKTSGPSTLHISESPNSASEEPYIPPPRTSTLGSQLIAKCTRSSVGDNHKMNPQSDLMNF